jgi:hypothetical protein
VIGERAIETIDERHVRQRPGIEPREELVQRVDARIPAIPAERTAQRRSIRVDTQVNPAGIHDARVRAE